MTAADRQADRLRRDEAARNGRDPARLVPWAMLTEAEQAYWHIRLERDGPARRPLD